MLSPQTILDQYLELSSHDLSRLVYQLASNAVLEWNGLTVRGGPKIVKFLRQKQHAGQAQSFAGAVTTVQPFEVRDTHLATKANPPENLAISPVREVPIATPSSPSTPVASGSDFRPEDHSFETPPKTLPALPHPPALTGGRRFLPFPSDDEDEDVDDPDQSSELMAYRQNTYSELQYLETVGTVRTANEPKHRGTRTTHHIPREDPSADSSGPSEATTSSSSSVGEKRTKLKLSYRTHLRTQEVQFALIIYEHISTRSTAVRRNLFGDEELHQNQESPRPHSPEPIPLPDSSSLVAPLPPSEDSPPVQPPGTPVKRRRIPPVIIGLRTSPRRTFAPDEAAAGPATSIQQTWPRKNSHSSAAGGGGGGGGSASKQRKLSSVSATIRKPLRF